MRPVLFYIGPLAVWSYGTFIALGMITSHSSGSCTPAPGNTPPAN